MTGTFSLINRLETQTYLHLTNGLTVYNSTNIAARYLCGYRLKRVNIYILFR